jgi:hypothetical protein
MSAIVATIHDHMRLNIFAHRENPEPSRPQPTPPTSAPVSAPPAKPAKTYSADQVVWGIVIRNGFDEMDDPWYHRGVTQHAYLEGHDDVALCGFRPPASGPHTRRRPRLGLPSASDHPMCGMCARMVVAPRPRVPLPIQPFRPAVAMPVAPTPAQPVPSPAHVAPPSAMAPPSGPRPAGPGVSMGPTGVPVGPAGVPPQPAGVPPQPAAGAPTSPWVRQRIGDPQPQALGLPLPSSHDGGLMVRGVHLADTER